MPTAEWFKENPKVSAYISSELSQRLEEWMKERSVKKVSQALTRILEEYLGVVRTEPNQSTADNARLETLEEKVANLSQELAELREAIANSQIEGKPKVNQSKSKGQLSLLDKPDESSLPVNKSNPNSEFSEITTTKKVAEFLGWTESKLKNRKNRNQLPIRENGYIINCSNERPGGPVTWSVQREVTQDA